MFEFPEHHHVRCPTCGAPVRGDDEAHECEAERLLDYAVHQHIGELERFYGELGAWLDSPAGRFAVWSAERTR